MFECLVNGEISPFVPADDRGLNYGDGVYETLAVEKGVPRWWQEHMNRLAKGCERIGLKLPPQEVLLREVQTASAGRARCVVKIMLTRGSGGRGYLPPERPTARRIVSSHPWPEGADLQVRDGIRVRICDLRLSVQPELGGIKHMNRLEQVMAARECAAAGFEEGILLDRDGYVISGVSANVFLACDRTLLTPRLDGCGVRGILRARIQKAFKGRCELRRITVDMINEADEIFFTNAIRGIIPVRSVDEQEFRVGPVTRELQAWLREILLGE